MPDSVGEAPSLVSDRSSCPSMSPSLFGLPQHRAFPSFQEASSGTSWPPFQNAQTGATHSGSMPMMTDTSSQYWGPNNTSKKSHIAAPSQQRFEQFIEVATRAHPVGSPVKHDQHRQFPGLPSHIPVTKSTAPPQQQQTPEVPGRRRPGLGSTALSFFRPVAESSMRPVVINYAPRYQHHQRVEIQGGRPPASSFDSRCQQQPLPDFQAGLPASVDSVAMRQPTSSRDSDSLPPLRDVIDPAQSARFLLRPTASFAPDAVSSVDTQTCDRSQYCVPAIRSPAPGSHLYPLGVWQHPSSPQNTQKQTASYAGPALSTPLKPMSLSHVLD